jgi:RNA polymerase sigma factor (sigma-70 family)
LGDTELQLNKTDYSAAEIYKKYSKFVRGVINYRVKNEALADDIFQDFFLHLVANPLSKDIKFIEEYLFQTVMNFIVTSLRRSAEYQGRLNRYVQQRRYVNRQSAPDARIINVEEAQKMFELIELVLPNFQATAVKRRYKDECDIHEVSETMGVDIKSVSRYISAGLGRIHRVLAVGESDKI